MARGPAGGHARLLPEQAEAVHHLGAGRGERAGDRRQEADPDRSLVLRLRGCCEACDRGGGNGRRNAREFSERYPKIAGRLMIGGEVCEDPHIERMIESFALLNSRIAKRLDDDYPEFTEALFEVLYPHYLRPLPATTSTRPNEPIVSKEEKLQWLGLEVKSALRLRQRKAESADDNRDTVEFVARFKVNGRAQRLHEISNFVREQADGGLRWFYVDGSFPE